MEGEGQGSDSGVAQGQEVSSEQGTEGTGGTNPAWNDFLEVVPSSLHSQVTPVLSKWDQGVQQKIQQVHSQYEPFKPFLEQGVQPDQLEYGLNLLNAIENNPQEVLKALQEFVGSEEQQGQEDQPPPDGSEDLPEFLQHPEIKKMQEMVNTMAHFLVQQRQTQQEAQESEELEQTLNSLREQHGDFDEEWVLSRYLNDDKMTDIEQAVQAYRELESSILAKQRQPGPKILGSGGSVPNQDLDPKNLDDKGRRKLVEQLLQQRASQNH